MLIFPALRKPVLAFPVLNVPVLDLVEVAHGAAVFRLPVFALPTSTYRC